MVRPVLLALVAGAALCYVLGRLLIRLAVGRRLALDDPERSGRRIHQQPTPRIGGPALFIALLLTIALALPAELWRNQQMQGLLLGGLLIMLLGFADDLFTLSGPVKLIGQTLIIGLVVYQFQLLVPYVNNPIQGGVITFPPWSSALVSIVWILITTNTLNFIDGIDGLAVSVTIAFAIVVGLVGLLFSQLGLTIIVAALLGCCLGFLPLNWYRARAFLGDSGAMLLGFAIGALSILSGAKLATTLLVLGLPMLDVANTFALRLWRRQSLFSADSEHLHYRLIRKGLSTGQTVALIAGISFSFGLLALVNNTTFKVAALVVLVLLSQAIILWSMRD